MPFMEGDQVVAMQAMRRSLVKTAKKATIRPALSAGLALVGLALLGSGCAAVAPLSSALGTVNPSASQQIYNTTELRLAQKNFVVVKANVIGQSKGFSLLGFITIVPARFTKAMNRLNAQAELTPGTPRTLANLVLEKDSSYWILFGIPRTSIRADVIEFTDTTQGQPPPGIAKAAGQTSDVARPQP
jgi:hypothetical protein